MNEAVKKFLEEGGQITQIPFGVPRDMQVCMNCKGLFETKQLTKGITRRCQKCHQRHTSFKERR